MKRAPDFIRKLLFDYEAQADWLLEMPGSTKDGIESPEAYHVRLMLDEGWLVEVGKHTMRMTAAGHDLLDAIRTDTVWNKTKNVAKEAGGFSIRFLGEIAMTILKQEVEKRISGRF